MPIKIYLEKAFGGSARPPLPPLGIKSVKGLSFANFRNFDAD